MRSLALCLLVVLLFTSCLSDLRPKDLREPEQFTEAMNEKGLAVLEKYAKVSGQAKWDKIQSYQVFLNDDFFGLLGKYAQPFGQKKNQFKLDYYPQENAGTLLFLNGKKKGKIWGYNEGNAYIRQSASEPVQDVSNKDIEFWLPTYQYFIELPFRISNADQIYHVGEEKYGLSIYDKVFISWKTTEPQKKLDQYLLWVNQENGLVDKMQYTIRDQGAIYKGTAIISEQTVYNGIIIPALIKVYIRENSRQPLHIMRPHNFRITTML